MLHNRPLSHQMGIARTLEKKLHSVGIVTIYDLEKVGAVEAYRRLQKKYGGKLRISYLYAFEGAIMGEHWFDFSKEQKAAIRAKAGI